MRKKKLLFVGFSLCALFIVWTCLLRVVDVASIGPHGSSVGFATVNGFFHSLTGTNMTLYVITDWLGLVPIFTALGFAILGLAQWIKRKSIRRVDKSILALGVFYAVVMAVYIFFEFVPINFRPVLIEGYLEVSYPSSTTMLVMCVMPTALMQFNSRIKNVTTRKAVAYLIIAFILFTVIGRLISGVHWLTDIVGGVIFSAGAVTVYFAESYIFKKFEG